MTVSAADRDTGAQSPRQLDERPVSASEATALSGRELLVKRVVAEAAGVISLELAAPGGGVLPRWEPGAHLSLRLRSGLVRQYSLCGDPRDRRTYRIAVLDDPRGRGGSRELHRTAARGTRVTVVATRNNFPLVPAADYRFVAGGIGITPILPMIQEAARRSAPWSLLYGGRSRRSMAFVDSLHALGGAAVTLVPEDRLGLPDLSGYLSGPSADGTPAADTAVYCCGPPAMIEAVRRHCRALGLVGSLHLESFGAPVAQRPDEVASGPSPIDVELRRSGTRVTVGPDRSILRAVREVLPQHPSSCEEGYCGTCEARVLDGVPEHRDTVLSQEEKARGDCMMICVSRALTPTLALDL